MHCHIVSIGYRSVMAWNDKHGHFSVNGPPDEINKILRDFGYEGSPLTVYMPK